MKIEASDEDEGIADAGLEENSKKKSKAVIAVVHNSEAAKEIRRNIWNILQIL